jgi:hypothetical protein
MKMGACILPEGHPHGFSDWRADGIKGFFAFSAAAFPMALRSEIAQMRHDMVGDTRRRYAAGFQAQPTQWFDHELMRSAALPASGAVPAMDVRRVRHRRKVSFSAPVSLPLFDTLRTSPLSPMTRDVSVWQRKCLCMLACGTLGYNAPQNVTRAVARRTFARQWHQTVGLLEVIDGVINFAQLSPCDGFIFFSPTKKLHWNYRMEENVMSKKAAEHHKKASEHLTHAARHHGEAAKHHDAGNHEKAAHHAHTARAHVIHGRGHAEEAVKAHAEEHGKK